VRKPEETEALLKNDTPKIIIAASGMATGGRILGYLERFIGDPRTTVLLAGYQGEGTRGRALLDGAAEIKMRGKFWKVKAHIELIEGLSAHADGDELIDWMSRLKNRPEKIFIVHGEPEGATALKKRITEFYKLNSTIPGMGEVIEL
jgi:metallo-beta-lactamase family protein